MNEGDKIVCDIDVFASPETGEMIWFISGWELKDGEFVKIENLPVKVPK